jgi:hypothetical protein
MSLFLVGGVTLAFDDADKFDGKLVKGVGSASVVYERLKEDFLAWVVKEAVGAAAD